MKPHVVVIDIGNTNVVAGLYRRGHLFSCKRWTTSTASPALWRKHLRYLVRRAKTVDGVCVASVVPQLDQFASRMVKRIFGCLPIFLTARTARTCAGISATRTVGSDRLANTIAAFHRYHRACIVVDFGTATTFDYVTSTGKFAGGAIAPGILLAHEALYRAAAKLPRVPLRRPPCVVGKTTATNIQSGLVYGYAGLVDHLVTLMIRETRTRPVVIATGGLARLIAPLSRTISVYHPHLTLEGIRLFWERYRRGLTYRSLGWEKNTGSRANPH